MARYLFQLSTVTPPGAYVRLDSASGSTSPTAASPVDSAYVIPGSIVHSDAATGELPRVAAGVATLYQKTLNASGAVTATATLTGTLVDGAGPGALEPQTFPVPYNTDPTGLNGTYASTTVGNRLRRAADRSAHRYLTLLRVMSNPPTISQGTSNQDATLTKSYRASVDGLGYWRTTGGIGQLGQGAFTAYQVAPVVTMPSGSGGNTSGDATHSSYAWSVEFMTDAPRVMFRVLNTTGSPMVEVDDQLIQASNLSVSGGGTAYILLDFSVGSATIVASTGVFTTSAVHGLQVGDQVILGTITTTTGATAGTSYWVKTTPSTTTFTLSATPGGTALSLTGDGSTASVSRSVHRKFRYEMGAASGFDGVYVGPDYTIWPPVDEDAVRVAVVGDSIETGTGASNQQAWSKIAAKMLGWTDVRQVAFGSTGFVAAGTTNTFGSATRVADAVLNNPDLLIIVTSQNDDGQAGVQAAALAAFQAYRTALPTAPIVVMGADPGSSGPSAARQTTETTAKAAFDAWADAKSYWIPVTNATDGAWFTGTGTTSAKTGSGNRDRFGFDSAHPNDAGHLHRARRLAQAFRRSVLPYMP